MRSLLRQDFQILQQQINGQPLIYCDNAATTQKPRAVIDAEGDFYRTMNATVHRSIHTLGERATAAYEEARAYIAHAIGALPHETIFTRGTTEGINAIAIMWGMQYIKEGDEIVLSQLEHHANLLPWQEVARVKNAQLKFIPIDQHGMLIMDNLDSYITQKTKLVAITHISNVLGTHIDLASIRERTRSVGAALFIDAAQSVPHQRIDVKAIDADFLAFSGHKMCGPTGIGILYIHEKWHNKLVPYHRGGNMVNTVDWYQATWAQAPSKFEAGTPPIAQAVGLKAAFEYLHNNVDFGQLKKHEAALCRTMITRLEKIPGVTLYGPLEQLIVHGHMVNFAIEGIHAHDVAAYLDSYGIAVRAGNHCSQPLSTLLGVQASVRASFYFYNTILEIETLCDRIEQLCNQY